MSGAAAALVATATGVLGGVTILGGLILIGHKTLWLPWPRGWSFGPAEKPMDPDSDAWVILLFLCITSAAGAAIGLAVLL